MAVRSLARSGIGTGGKYISFLAGNAAYNPDSDFLIEEQILGSNAASITFTSIPQTYKHLQLRYTAQIFESSSVATLRMSVNGDTASNWGRHYLRGAGNAVGSTGTTNTNFDMDLMLMPDDYGTNANIFAGGIIDILEYANTSKNKVVRAIGGNPYTGTYRGVGLHSGVWLNTAGITSITLSTNNSGSYPLKSGSRFSLYGSLG